MSYAVTRYHDISCGHRVVNHESKCRYLHGHNYRIHFHCEANELDGLGRVIDFSMIKSQLCMWIEEHWDHKTLLWLNDPTLEDMKQIARDSIVVVPFNPTAENMAEYLVTVVGPRQLKNTGVRLTKVTIEETAKCHAVFAI